MKHVELQMNSLSKRTDYSKSELTKVSKKLFEAQKNEIQLKTERQQLIQERDILRHELSQMKKYPSGGKGK